MLAVSQPHWVCPCSRRVCFPCLHCLSSRLLCQELSEAGPRLYALPRSKLLRFRHSGSPQRRRLGWACVLRPSQVRATQVSGVWRSRLLRLIVSPVPAAQFSGCTTGAPSQVDVDCLESQEVLVSNEACLQFDRCLSGAMTAPLRLWLPSPACHQRGGMGRSAAFYLCSVLCSVRGPGGVLG